MNLDTRHAPAKGRRLIVDQTKPSDANEHQLALELSEVCLVAKHVRCRDESTRIVRGVVDPQAAVRLSGDDQVANSHGFDAGHTALHKEERFAAGQTKCL